MMAFFRRVIAILWALRHPMRTTVIDWETGKEIATENRRRKLTSAELRQLVNSGRLPPKKAHELLSMRPGEKTTMQIAGGIEVTATVLSVHGD